MLSAVVDPNCRSQELARERSKQRLEAVRAVRARALQTRKPRLAQPARRVVLLSHSEHDYAYVPPLRAVSDNKRAAVALLLGCSSSEPDPQRPGRRLFKEPPQPQVNGRSLTGAALLLAKVPPAPAKRERAAEWVRDCENRGRAADVLGNRRPKSRNPYNSRASASA